MRNATVADIRAMFDNMPPCIRTCWAQMFYDTQMFGAEYSVQDYIDEVCDTCRIDAQELGWLVY